MRVEEDIDEGGGDSRQCLRVQCEDTKAVLRALNGMHRGTEPCSGYRDNKVKRLSWIGVTPGGRTGQGYSISYIENVLHPFKRSALLWEEVPFKSGCWRADLTVLGLGKAIAGIVLGNRHRLPAYFTVYLELLGQCVDHHRQVLLPYLGQGK